MLDAPEMLRSFMAEKELTQDKFATKYKVSQASVSAWLGRRKRPGLQLALRLERITGIKASAWEKVVLKREAA